MFFRLNLLSGLTIVRYYCTTAKCCRKPCQLLVSAGWRRTPRAIRSVGRSTLNWRSLRVNEPDGAWVCQALLRFTTGKLPRPRRPTFARYLKFKCTRCRGNLGFYVYLRCSGEVKPGRFTCASSVITSGTNFTWGDAFFTILFISVMYILCICRMFGLNAEQFSYLNKLLEYTEM